MTEPEHGSGSTVAAIDPDLLGPGCPVRRVLRLVGDKWTPVVLYCLSAGAWRFNDLQRRIPDISKKMLTQVLRALEAEGLLQRTIYPVLPPKTEYRLTELGERMHEPMAMLCRWAEANTALLDTIERHAPDVLPPPPQVDGAPPKSRKRLRA